LPGSIRRARTAACWPNGAWHRAARAAAG
jgi:hypothetical protein